MYSINQTIKTPTNGHTIFWVGRGELEVVLGLWLRAREAVGEGWRAGEVWRAAGEGWRAAVEGSTPLGLVGFDVGMREEGRVAGRISPA